ncbi:UNVERIFIED_CONTAM: hypothetical protein FKN15_070391 [Acipenser sinensis]
MFDDTNLREVLHRLKLQPGNCKLMQREVVFLGHRMGKDGIRTDPEKEEAVQRWPIPTDQQQLLGFIGLASYYRCFVLQFLTRIYSLCYNGSLLVNDPPGNAYTLPNQEAGTIADALPSCCLVVHQMRRQLPLVWNMTTAYKTDWTRAISKLQESVQSVATILTVQPPQSYSVGGQHSSGQLTGKPTGARPDYRGHWCAVRRGYPGRPNPPSPRTTLGQLSATPWERPRSAVE